MRHRFTCLILYPSFIVLSLYLGLYGPAVALFGLSYTPAGNVLAAVLILTIVVGLNVGHITGLMVIQ